MRNLIPILMLLLLSVSLPAKERETFKITAKKETLSRFREICQINDLEPTDFIIKLHFSGVDEDQRYSGYYSIHINLQDSKCSVQGDKAFHEMVRKFVVGLEANPDIKTQLFDMTNKPDFQAIHRQLWKMGIKLDVDR